MNRWRISTEGIKKKTQIEMVEMKKNKIMSEMESLFGGFNIRLNIVDGGVSELKDRSREIIQVETQREK